MSLCYINPMSLCYINPMSLCYINPLSLLYISPTSPHTTNPTSSNTTNTANGWHLTVPHPLLQLLLLAPTRNSPPPHQLHGDHDADAHHHNHTKHHHDHHQQRRHSPRLHLRRPLDLRHRRPIIVAATVALAGRREARELLLEHHQQPAGKHQAQPDRLLVPGANSQGKFLFALLRREEILLRRHVQ